MKLLRKNKSGVDSDQRRSPVSYRSEGSRPGFSYYKSSTSHSDSKSPVSSDQKSDRVKNLIKFSPGIVAVAVIILSLLFSLTLSSTPAVDTVSDQPSPYRSLDEYAAKADEIMSQNPLNLTKFTIDTTSVEQELVEAFPELNAAAIRLPVLGRKPTLVLDIRQPEAILVSNSKSLVLDSRGVAVSEIKDVNPEQRRQLAVVEDGSGIDIKLGEQAVTTDTIEFIKSIRAQFAAKQIAISRLELPVVVNELNIYPEGQKYYVKTDTTGDPRLQFGGYMAVKEHLEGKGITPAEYIDARVEEKVFYK